jgi:hypothetical protein
MRGSIVTVDPHVDVILQRLGGIRFGLGLACFRFL